MTAQDVKTRRYPFDYDAINKGDFLTVQALEEITGFMSGTDSYRFKLLALREDIMRAKEAMGDPVVVKGDQHGLRVLTDSEAVPYLWQQSEQSLQRRWRVLRQMGYVEVTNLTNDEARAHERSATLLTLSLMADRKARQRQLRLNGQEERKEIEDAHVPAPETAPTPEEGQGGNDEG